MASGFYGILLALVSKRGFLHILALVEFYSLFQNVYFAYVPLFRMFIFIVSHF